MTENKVIFLDIREPARKLHQLAKIAQQHFLKKEPLQILAPDIPVLEFVDALLWRLPEESFVPHAIASSLTQELIIITMERTFLNQATALFNLCSIPFLDFPIKTLYDFDDHTTLERKSASNLRYQAYRQAAYTIVTS